MKKILVCSILTIIISITGTYCSSNGGNNGNGNSNNTGFVTSSYWEQRKRKKREPIVTVAERQTIKGLASSQTDGHGDVEVFTIPPSANVIIDGVKVGKAPVVLHRVRAGRHFIKIMLDTYRSVTKIVEVKKKKKIKLKIELQKYLSKLNIVSSMKGADVFIDGRLVGKTPVTLNDVTMGRHLIWLQKIKNGERYFGFKEIWVNEENKAWKLQMRPYRIPDNYVMIPAGRFKMSIKPQYPYEGPTRRVYTNAFYISKTEVTNAEFLRYFPNHKLSQYSKGQRHPVTRVTWLEAYNYCKRIGGRLPTEAEWEKAARGGRNMRYALIGGIGRWRTGKNIWMGFKSLAKGTAIVGKYGKNRYGIYDLNGNANEWVYDWFSETYFKWGSRKNPLGPEFGVKKVMKGGAWFDKTWLANLATRYFYLPDERNDFAGFRCVINDWRE